MTPFNPMNIHNLQVQPICLVFTEAVVVL